MEVDSRVMADLKRQIEKGRMNFKKSPKERITEAYIVTRLEALEVLIKQYTAKHQTMISTYDEKILSKSSYITEDIFNEGYETYLDYKAELTHALAKFQEQNPTASTKSTTRSNNESMVKLPKISIPMFSGAYSQWTSFRDLFVSLVHNNAALDDVQRLHYLKTQVTGEAERLIKHLPITQSNYSVCWNLLKSRYNNKRFMSNCILKRLFNQRSMNVESAQAIKDLLDTTSDCLHEMTNLGIDVNSWDVIIIYIISMKLDAETRKQWELQVSNFGEDLPSFLQFRDFLESRFRALEFVEPSKNKPRPSQNPVHSNKVMHAISNDVCPHCSEPHKLYHCKKFSNEVVNTRRDLAKSLNVCFNCLGPNHGGRQCRIPTKCRICQRKHHTLLHPTKDTNVVEAAVPTGTTSQDKGPEEDAGTHEINQIHTHFSSGNVNAQTLLATALVKAESKNGHPQVLRALLDQGSQASFISEAAVQLLRLQKINAKSYISCIGGGTSDLTSKYMVIINIQSLHDPAFNLRVKAHVLKTVTSVLPEKTFSIQNWPDITYLTLADPQYNTPNRIDILLGSEVYCSILKEGLLKNPSCSMIAQDTHFGWVLSGQISSQTPLTRNLLCMHVQVDEVDILKQFWELEQEPNLQVKILTPEEEACEAHFAKTVRRDEDGRYVVELPFRTQEPQCQYGRTRDIAVKSLVSLEKRLSKRPELQKQYSNVMSEYLQLRHMEVVPQASEASNEQAGKVWLPHHAVVRADKSTTKTRVVFNASSKGTNGVSLNDTLMVGPTLQPDLRHIVMRWRTYPICLTADIIKMYRQIKVADKHVDFQRIVWRDADSEIKDHRLLRVTFGTACAPYLAVKALQQTAVDEGQEYPLAADKVRTDFFMDDLMTGSETEAEAVKLYKEMNELLAKGCFTLQKWSSNKIELLDELKMETGKDLEIKIDEVTKILGLTWNRRSDDFDYTVKLSPPVTANPAAMEITTATTASVAAGAAAAAAAAAAVPETKRKIIAEISRLFDPLGWIAPCIITAKVFIQKLWIAGLNWDDTLPEHLLQEWSNYRTELSSLVHFHIPRWLRRSRDDISVELHGFSDASNVAYAAVVYMRVVDRNGKTHSNLVTAKTKVAPIKQISIPRLELCGAVLIAKLLEEVAGVLDIPKSNLHAWTDSTVVLAWLSDHPSRWKTFIANRTSEILTHVDSSQWSYVQSKDNPADGASRGLTPSELVNSRLWKEGPTWLKDDTIDYKRPVSILTRTELERKVIKAHVTYQEADLPWTKFSTLQKLVRVIAYCRRFLQLRSPHTARPKSSPYLTAAELKEALKCCIRHFQSQFYVNVMKSLDRRHELSSLNPFIDAEGVLRVGGRIDNSNLPEDSKHPVIIPDKSYLTNLLVKDAHEKTMHGGQQLTITYLRSKYWIPKIKSLVRSHIHGCVPCIRNAAVTRSQLMGQLPSCRVTPNKPFLCSGVDYAGPINIRVSKGRGQKSYKGYICLFVCMSSRAVHLEAVSDLSTEGFLAAFKRFVARRGRCNQVWSDNGTNFVGASKELKQLFNKERNSMLSEVANVLANNGTEWNFIPPHAPNFGGLWEAGIKSTKHHLKRVIGDSTLTFEEMTTVLSQIEACLNSRPLWQLSTNSDDPVPLTPGHFLVGEPLLIAPDGSYEQDNIGILRRWQLTQKMVQQFWRKWAQEYLVNFFQRYKWNRKTSEPKVGDVVLVKEDNLPPTKWLYGRVVDIHPGKDGITRVVTLRYKGSLIKRPTSKLCMLPANPDSC